MAKNPVHLTLGLVWLAATSLLVAAYLDNQRGIRHNLAMAQERSRAAQTLATLQAERDTLEQELAILVQTRAPEMYRFALNQVIPVRDTYVENVRFAVTEGRYSAQILGHPATRHLEFAHIDLVIFDRSGVQIGQGRIETRPGAWPVTEHDTPNGKQWNTPPITWSESREPAYFSIQTYR